MVVGLGLGPLGRLGLGRLGLGLGLRPRLVLLAPVCVLHGAPVLMATLMAAEAADRRPPVVRIQFRHGMRHRPSSMGELSLNGQREVPL